MIPKPVARILLCAILSDTLKLGKDKDVLSPDHGTRCRCRRVPLELLPGLCLLHICKAPTRPPPRFVEGSPCAPCLPCSPVQGTWQSVTTTNADRFLVTVLCILGECEDPDELARAMFRAKTEWIVGLLRLGTGHV